MVQSALRPVPHSLRLWLCACRHEHEQFVMLLFLMAKARKSFDALSELHAIITGQVRARAGTRARAHACV